MGGQKLFHGPVEVETVLLVVKTVALVFLDHVFHGDASLLQSLDDLVGFIDVDPWVFGALGDKQGAADLVDMKDRGGRFQEFLVLLRVSDHFAHHFQ